MVAGSDKVKPPTFDGNGYTRWKRLVNIWQTSTSTEADKRGPILIMNMRGRALDIALGLQDTSITNVLSAMEKVYGDTNNVVKLYQELETFVRSPSQSIKEYIQVFEQKSEELKQLGLQIPDTIKSVKMLNGAQLSELLAETK